MRSANRHFLRAFLRNKTQVGALTPSGDKLADAMVEWIDWSSVESVVEFGPGTGVFTEKILTRLQPGSKFFAVEQDEHLADITRARCPGAMVYNDCVSNISTLCRNEGIEKVDAVISGLPWAVFSPELQEELIGEMKSVLKPGGKFVTFAYLQGMLLPAAQRFRQLLNNEFEEVHQSRVIWSNVPPAFVYRCVQKDAPA
ncbi:methyltransferase domain-containing protein [Verrucomicrobiales bacterium BCK34]|nr:methyltransferase domain-containing protein [Verrucomicrobiales bacterium BCK34]